jgi:hypothetical protein
MIMRLLSYFSQMYGSFCFPKFIVLDKDLRFLDKIWTTFMRKR